MPEPTPDFLGFLNQLGIPLTGAPLIDGKLHRYKTAGDHEANSWYVLYAHPGGLVVGRAGCWKRGISAAFSSRDKSGLSADEWKAFNASRKNAEAARAEEEKKNHARVRQECATLFNTAPPATADHPYLHGKGVGVHGRVVLSNNTLHPGWLAIPLQDTDGVIHTAEFIADNGQKKYSWQGEKRGHYFPLAETPGGPLLICEGYATGASLHEATGWSVWCAMDAGNLLLVSQSARKLFPNRTIVICADNDQYPKSNGEINNIGVIDAEKAAKAIKAQVAVPVFSDDAMVFRPTDFNDLHGQAGLQEVRRQVMDALPDVGVPIGDIQPPPEPDPTEIIRYRYLCQGGGMLVVGPTGVGKSSLLIQAGALWTNALGLFGAEPSRCMKILMVQAENDDGDVTQIRDGVCTGLGFNQEQRYQFFRNFIVKASRGLTGKRFCDEELARLLDFHSPDILMLDPMFSFVGCPVKDQAGVTEFLRVWLNPLLYDHHCCAVLSHHENKPMRGNDKVPPTTGEMAYSGSGTIEWANWSRAIMALKGTADPGVYSLNAAKRGIRLGWRNGDDVTPIYEKYIAHSKQQGVIYWRLADEDEAAEVSSDAGRKPTCTMAEFLATLVNGMDTGDWLSNFKKETGLAKSSFYSMRRTALSQHRITKNPQNHRWQLAIIQPHTASPPTATTTPQEPPSLPYADND